MVSAFAFTHEICQILHALQVLSYSLPPSLPTLLILHSFPFSFPPIFSPLPIISPFPAFPNFHNYQYSFPFSLSLKTLSLNPSSLITLHSSLTASPTPTIVTINHDVCIAGSISLRLFTHHRALAGDINPKSLRRIST